MELPGLKRSDVGGPLAELAQIVGQDDPFRAMFRQGKTVAQPEPVAAFPSGATEHFDDAADTDVIYADDDRHADGIETSDLRPSVHDAEEWTPVGSADERRYDGHDYDDAVHAGEHHAGENHGEAGSHGFSSEAMPIDAPHYVAPPLTPDLWAESEGEQDHAPAPVMADEAGVDAKAPRRPLFVLLAVLALTGGGLGATFLSRSGSGAVASSTGSAPTIMAANGPTKVKQTDGASDTTPEDADAALLSKNGASSGGAVHVVNSQEQPIDLSQLPKPAGGQSDTVSATGSSPFPEPKKVKTFLVRPDGSLVNSNSPAPARSGMPQLAMGGVPSGDAMDSAPPPAPASRASTPKPSGRAATTPKAPPTSIADLSAPDAGDPAAAKPEQPASGGAKSVGGHKPVEMADAAAPDATAATSTAGNFALQLAASPSEQDARSAFTKLQKKYSELGSFQPTVKKVDNGQKTVYRLRVGNLSQDQAKSLCSHLQAGGGSCFVVHN